MKSKVVSIRLDVDTYNALKQSKLNLGKFIKNEMKKFIKEKGEMNTSAETIDMLSKAIERLCTKGIESAKADGRKTVMARDIIIDHI